MRLQKQSRGFTLVELLVVIGVIALLISILLPALNSARRSASAVKCAAALRDLGNAFKFYAQDNKNYYPPAQLTSGSTTGEKYEVEGVQYPVVFGSTHYGAYWFNFVARYVTKKDVGAASTTLHNQSDVRRGILWCGEFQGYTAASATSATFDANPVQTGYCMNGYPTFDAGYPAGTTVFPPVKEYSYQTNWGQPYDPVANPIPYRGGFMKATIWGKRGAERMLLADGKLWLGETGRVNPVGFNGQVPTQNSADENKTRGGNETYISLWRHGKIPQAKDAGYYRVTGSKVGFNILYADGHVNTENDAKVAYTSTRMKFPG